MATIDKSQNTAPFFSYELRKLMGISMMTMLAFVSVTIFLLPFGNMTLLSLKTKDQQIASATGSVLPVDVHSFNLVLESMELEATDPEQARLLRIVFMALDENEIEVADAILKAGQIPDEIDAELLVKIEANVLELEQDILALDTLEKNPELSAMDRLSRLLDEDENFPDDSPYEIAFNGLGEDFGIYEVEVDGEKRDLALAIGRRDESYFVDPTNLSDGIISWEGSWRTLAPVTELHPHFENFEEAWLEVKFVKLFTNTLIIALSGMVGTLVSSIFVAYAFARFPLPYKNALFIILISTIILPRQVTLIPTYAFFSTIGWTGSWLPLIVPHFFSNAYNVFLFRQYFLTLPRELDEAAMIDGAGPLRILLQIVIPMSWPVIVAVGLFHFIYAWNDYFEPLIYLLGKDDLLPIAVGVQKFNFVYGSRPELVQATSLLAMILPLLIFFFAQKVFMRGVVITGVEK